MPIRRPADPAERGTDPGAASPPSRLHRVTARPAAARAGKPARIRTTRTLVGGIHSMPSGCRVTIRDVATGDEVRSGRAAAPAGRGLDPHTWWQAMLDAIAAAGGFADVSAFGVGAGHGAVVAMDADGHLVPGTASGDTAAAARELLAEVGAGDLLRRAGTLPGPRHTLALLRGLRDAAPHEAVRVEAVALPHDWLTWRLRGFGPRDEMPVGLRLEELVTDRSDASVTGYWNPATGKWDHALFDEALGRAAIKPRVMPPDAWGGESWKMPSHGIKSERVISIGGAPAALAAFGLALQPGDALVSLGAAGLGGIVCTPAREPAASDDGVIAGRADATGGFLPCVRLPDPAPLLAQAARLAGVAPADLDELAGRARPGSGGVVLLPREAEAALRARGPAGLRSAFHAAPADTAAENLARAALEGVLCAAADAVDRLRAAGIPVTRVILVGAAPAGTAPAGAAPIGAAPSGRAAGGTTLRTAAAQIFTVPTVAVTGLDTVAYGVAAQAVWAKTHRRAAWPAPFDTPREPDPRPQVRDQFASCARAAKTAPAR